jgi:hypothetical protein
MKTGTHAGIWVGQQINKLRMYNNIAINCTAEVGQKITTEATTVANLMTTEPAMVVDGMEVTAAPGSKSPIGK